MHEVHDGRMEEKQAARKDVLLDAVIATFYGSVQ